MNSNQTATITLAQTLLRIDSVTPEDKGCQTIIADFLTPLGFNNDPMPFGEVTNLWSRRGQTAPLVVFAGHTDVVPTGPIEKWQHPPFSAQIDGDMLCARGAADMKSAIACFMVATERFIHDYPDHPGSIGFLITSDEEGPAVDGTVKVIETLEARQEKIDFCLVGEPSSDKKLGDSIKNGRRGSLNATLTIKGVQGHIAYPQLADNPVHKALPALAALTAIEWDQGNDYFPPTSLQISNIHAGTGATNVIPGDLQVMFNLRFSTEHTPETLKQGVIGCLAAFDLDYELNWNLSGLPFITPAEGILIQATSDAIEHCLGYRPTLSTSGGTSDGRFIAPTGAQVIEFGPLNDTIHKVNERVSVADLNQLTDIYYHTLVNLLVKAV
ncbi:succinyl-diaminopimelate desuccinylase [Thiomicrospira sp. ALE5]|uniref:succinyl-diaminopimelate desuccinylase n=1 Tax=Thiomicrospira sp. ALE5 TaxID=748650 RepID=UPI0008E3B498|nr:succinyl-diaminopimelate desuccinylase [Thiomicrospira sp. ALE5]SFR51960.1 succinyldiaminopimelate desuccinylase [Thiomicrospira sp. ALE5]